MCLYHNFFFIYQHFNAGKCIICDFSVCLDIVHSMLLLLIITKPTSGIYKACKIYTYDIPFYMFWQLTIFSE
jgi:hypothetical protein